MPKQVLIIKPQNELTFKVDFSGMLQPGHPTLMNLMNPTNDIVLFKIKTTAPKKYCVRPNSGFLEPHSKTDITITPQPVYVDANEITKHKFMVQSAISAEANINSEQFWKDIDPTRLMDSKLKCVFEMPDGSPAANRETADGPVPAAAAPDIIKKKATVSNDVKSSTPKEKHPQNNAEETTENSAHLEATKKRFDLEDNKIPKKADNDINNAAEFERLLEEEGKLRQENLRLQDELIRLRTAASGDSKVIGKRHSYEPPEKTQMMNMPIMLVAIGVGLLGIIIGKFFI